MVLAVPDQGPQAARGFVGRASEMEALLGGLGGAVAGRGRLILVGGEPGIGKSRLADELAARSRERGARVLWGRCWEVGGAPAYWPWVQPIRSCLRDLDREAVRAHLGDGAGHVARMVPEVRELLADVPPSSALDTDEARFQLFDATARFLGNVARAQPLVVILDDIHAADVPSLLLLRFLASTLHDSHLLMVATYRDGDHGPGHPLTTALAELSREPATTRLQLRGLTRSDVARFIELTTARPPPHRLVAAIHEQTEGNPLFVGEVVRLLVREGRLEQPSTSDHRRLGIPTGVRQVIGQRLGHLSPECMRVLGPASVLGREFALIALERLTGVGADRLLHLLSEAIDARAVGEVPGAPGRWRFSHAVIRDVLYEDLGGPQRVQLHHTTSEVLERLYSADLEPNLAELAHHCFEAAPGGAVGKAIDYARRAGERAIRLLAHEEAVRLFRMALAALALERTADETMECELLLSLGDALMRAGDAPAAKDSFRAAAAIARRLGLPRPLARAALGYGGRFVWSATRGDHLLVELLDDAARMLGDAPSALAIRVQARLAAALRDAPTQSARRHALSEHALAVARQLGDAATLAYALEVRTVILCGPDDIDARLALAAEMLRLAESSGDRERRLEAHHWRLMAFWEQGDARGLEVEVAAQTSVAEELRQPAQLWYATTTRAMHALFVGRFDAAEALISRALELGTPAQSWNANQSFWLQSFALRRERGELSGLEPQIRRLIDDNPAVAYWRCVLALVCCEGGRTDEARAVFDDLVRTGFEDLPRDEDWLVAMTLLAEVCAHLGDQRQAAAIHTLLAPYATTIALTPPNLSTGAVARSLGLLATTRCLWTEAEHHFQRAQELHRKMGARPWLARALRDQAAMLLVRGGPDDRDRAAALVADALPVCRELGMRPLTEQLEAMQRPRAPTAPAGAGVFRREGEYWSISFAGDLLRLRDSKGLGYIARLLREPGQAVHVLELTGGGDGRRLDGDAGPLLDARAKAAYRQRLAELERELETATAGGDSGGAARLVRERDSLIRELARAVGLGGRDRRAASAAERARVNVTRAVKAVIGRLREQSPALGRHFEVAIKTGVSCRYQPEPDSPFRWQL